MYKILIIKADDETTESIKEDLETHGYEVDIASNGEVGLEIFEKNKYDLILLDLEAPKGMGGELLRKIRQKDPFVYVLIYTNCAEFESIKALVDIGIDGYMNKTELRELINMIQNKLDPIMGNEIKEEYMTEDTFYIARYKNGQIDTKINLTQRDLALAFVSGRFQGYKEGDIRIFKVDLDTVSVEEVSVSEILRRVEENKINRMSRKECEYKRDIKRQIKELERLI